MKFRRPAPRRETPCSTRWIPSLAVPFLLWYAPVGVAPAQQARGAGEPAAGEVAAGDPAGKQADELRRELLRFLAAQPDRCRYTVNGAVYLLDDSADAATSAASALAAPFAARLAGDLAPTPLPRAELAALEAHCALDTAATPAIQVQRFRLQVAVHDQLAAEWFEPDPTLMDRARLRTPGYQILVAEVLEGVDQRWEQVRLQDPSRAPLMSLPSRWWGMIDDSAAGLAALAAWGAELVPEVAEPRLRLGDRSGSGPRIEVGFHSADPRPRWVGLQDAERDAGFDHLTLLRYGGDRGPAAAWLPSEVLQLRRVPTGLVLEHFRLDDVRVGEAVEPPTLRLAESAHLYDERGGRRQYFGPRAQVLWPIEVLAHVVDREARTAQPPPAPAPEPPAPATLPQQPAVDRFLLLLGGTLLAGGLALATAPSAQGARP
jgi:hypothetical protein